MEELGALIDLSERIEAPFDRCSNHLTQKLSESLKSPDSTGSTIILKMTLFGNKHRLRLSRRQEQFTLSPSTSTKNKTKTIKTTTQSTTLPEKSLPNLKKRQVFPRTPTSSIHSSPTTLASLHRLNVTATTGSAQSEATGESPTIKNRCAAMRWRVETFFEDSKHDLGLGRLRNATKRRSQPHWHF